MCTIVWTSNSCMQWKSFFDWHLLVSHLSQKCLTVIKIWFCRKELLVYRIIRILKVYYPWTLFFKTLCIFSKNKATLDKVSYGSGQKCSKELKNHSCTLVETTVVKLQKKCAKINIFHVLSHKAITTWVSEILEQ